MNKYLYGAIAGFAATVVLSIMMVAKSMLGIMPELDVIGMLSGMLGTTTTFAWVVHFAIGVTWGVLFAALYSVLPGATGIVKGIVFSLFAWLAMMIMVMPMASLGLFGLGLGIMAPVMTAMLHVIFGAVMGFAFDKMATSVRSTGGMSAGIA